MTALSVLGYTLAKLVFLATAAMPAAAQTLTFVPTSDHDWTNDQPYWKGWSDSSASGPAPPDYLNSALMKCSAGVAVEGVGLVTVGNRMTIQILCADNDETLIPAPDHGWDNSQPFWNGWTGAETGLTAPAYLDAELYFCPDNGPIIGAGAASLANRLVFMIVCNNNVLVPDPSTFGGWSNSQPYWQGWSDSSASGPTAPPYVNASLQGCPFDELVYGAGFQQIGNRLALQVACSSP